MKAFVAIDSFKGSLSTFEANEAVCNALKECCFDEIVSFPVSDGGEGFCKVLSTYLDHEPVTVQAHSPLGCPCKAEYIMTKDKVAVIESASVCGYTQVPPDKKNPLNTSSFGLGEMIVDALSRGAGKIIIGLGGTSTCDGGVGMLQAMGASFYCGDAHLVAGEAAMLKPVTAVDLSNIRCNADIEVWVDTQATFYGEISAVNLYGKQKGLDSSLFEDADEWMKSIWLKINSSSMQPAGSGAAGGIGGALFAVFGAKLVSGAEAVLDISGFKSLVSDPSSKPDYVITGEGRFDYQTLTGKLPYVVAECSHGAKVICLAGKTDGTGCSLFEKILPVTPDDMPLKYALMPDVASQNLRRAVLSIFLGRLF